MNRIRLFLAILSVSCLSACSDDKTQKLEQQVSVLTSQVGQLTQLVDSLTNQVAHLGSDLRAQVDSLSQKAAATHDKVSASQAPKAEIKDSGRFQLVYAPFPIELEKPHEFYRRFFLIDTTTGKIWRYEPQSSISDGNKVVLYTYEGFIAVPVVELQRQLQLVDSGTGLKPALQSDQQSTQRQSQLANSGTPVTFAYSNPNAKSVHVAGKFNNWLDNVDGKVTGHYQWEMLNDGAGNWKLTVPLWPGRFGFKYVIDGGERWERDPNLPKDADGNSVIEVRASEP